MGRILATTSSPDETLLSPSKAGRLAALLYLGAAAATLTTLPLPQAAGTNRWILFLIGAGALGVGGFTWAAPWDQWGRRRMLVLALLGLVLIAAGNSFSGTDPFAYDIFFVLLFMWVGISYPPGACALVAPLAAVAYVIPIPWVASDISAGYASAALVIPVCLLAGESLAWSGRLLGRARRALQSSEQRYRILVEQSPDAILVAHDDAWVFVNAAAAALLGAPAAADLIGRPVLDSIDVRSRERFERIQRDPASVRGLAEVRMVRRDGSAVDVEVAGMLLEAEGTRALQLVVRDVTLRRRAEDALRASMATVRRVDAERARLLAHIVRAQEAERLRVAEDIHDDTIQVMTAAAIHLDLLKRQIADQEQQGKVAETSNVVLEAIERLRRLVFDLRPPVLDDEGLAAAFREALASRSETVASEGTEVEDLLGDEPPIDVRTIAYRIGQEALTNIRKHAHASRVRVVLESENGGVKVTIEDDGDGFEPDGDGWSPSGHFGLRSMRERAEMAGGRCDIHSAPARGTTVEFWLPADHGASVGQATRRAS
jgi:PAS domain S-box-containing protein